ncbi:MAG: sulfatase-like hydrolase/transferase, partial [Myxococcales bacterium]|nr:sulfatase-like hydrolase/transferase [Myxococcales bacterium]
DEQFGRLVADLQRRGLYDDTMIIVTADHGEEFAEHGGFWHGTTLYDEQIHVPLFVKLPGNERAGTHVAHWVQSIDLMPSILRRVGIDVPDGVQGGSIEEGSSRVYAEESHEGNVLESIRERRDFEELKLITANAGNPRGLEPVELYTIADDPTEQHNIASDHQDEVQALITARDEARRAAAEAQQRGVARSRAQMLEATRDPNLISRPLMLSTLAESQRLVLRFYETIAEPVFIQTDLEQAITVNPGGWAPLPTVEAWRRRVRDGRAELQRIITERLGTAVKEEIARYEVLVADAEMQIARASLLKKEQALKLIQDRSRETAEPEADGAGAAIGERPSSPNPNLIYEQPKAGAPPAEPAGDADGAPPVVDTPAAASEPGSAGAEGAP